MPTYSITKAKDNLSKLIDRAIAREEVAITRRGKVLAYLRSAVAGSHRQPPRELVAEIMARAKKASPSGVGRGYHPQFARRRYVITVSIHTVLG